MQRIHLNCIRWYANLHNCMEHIEAHFSCTIQIVWAINLLSRFCAYTVHSSLQDTSCGFWYWWVAGNNWSNESCSCSCTSTMQLQNASVDGAPANTHWNPSYLRKGEFISFYVQYMWANRTDHPAHIDFYVSDVIQVTRPYIILTKFTWLIF